MPYAADDIRPLLRDLREELKALYGDRLVDLVLYGSYARGDAHEESDVDVLVVLRGAVEPGREIRRMSDIRTRYGLAHNCALSLLPASEDDYRDQPTGWLHSIRTEGISI